MSASSQYYSVTARVGVPHRHEVEVTIPLVGPAGATGPAGAAGASAWDDITGKPSTFAPSAHSSTHHTGGSDPLTAANIGAAKAITNIELEPNGTTTITTSQLPARGIAFIEGGGNFTVNLPTPGLRESGLWFSIKTEHESFETGNVFITVVHNAANLLTAFELTQDEGSIDFLWDGYAWTYANSYLVRSFPGRVLQLPLVSGTLAIDQPADNVFRIVGSADATKKLAFEVDGLTTATTRTLTVPDASGTIARTEDFAAPPSIGNTTPAAGSFTTLNATGTTELVNGGTTAGPFRVYNTFTSATNFERLNLRWASNVAIIGTEKGSAGGTARALEFQTDGTSRWSISTVGHLLPSATNTYDIGASAGNRPRNIFAAGYMLSNSGFYFGAAGAAVGLEGTPASGIMRLFADFGFTRLQFGGADALWPALKRSSTSLQVRLADDSAFAPFACAGLTLNGDLTASTRNIVTDITTGTKIGTATNQKIGFFNATPVVQQAAIADATDAATTQARLNDLLATMRTFGLIAT